MAASRDQRIVLGILGAMVVLIVIFSILSPANEDDNPLATTYNSGSAGTKAAYLVLGELGYGAERWEAPPDDLANVDAAKTTLILAEPNGSDRLVRSTVPQNIGSPDVGPRLAY